MLTQWDNAANLPLTPRTIRRGWWRCEKGHHWQSVLYRRTEGAQCPYCAGRAAWPGDNDLATYSLELTKEWHPVENLPLTPNQVLPGSHKIVWWVHREGMNGGRRSNPEQAATAVLCVPIGRSCPETMTWPHVSLN